LRFSGGGPRAMSAVVQANAAVMLLFALIMALVALGFGETAPAFAEAAVLLGALGLLIALASRRPRPRMNRPATFLLTASVWVTASLAGALPLYLCGLGAIDAVFESMSGLTTTGATVMSGLDGTPHGILMWRALLQALGGVGFVVTGMALLPFLRTGGMQLFRTESSDKDDKELATAARFAGMTVSVYLLLIGLCGMVYHLGGMNLFDAVTHALTTLSTGGFSNYDASFGHFQSPFLQWAATLFMLLGALPFVWYYRVFLRRHVRSEQVVALLATLALAIGVLTAWLVWTSERGLAEALRLVAFNVVSVVTTTGFATQDYTAWGPFAVAVFVILTAVGGCTGSTAGGAKVMRWVILLRAVRLSLKRASLPHGVFALRYENRPVADDVLYGVIAFFTFYMATIGLLTIALDLAGLDFQTAVTGALTSVANVGPGAGEIIGPAGNFAPLSPLVKVILTFGMYAGRLELMTVYVLLSLRFWRDI